MFNNEMLANKNQSLCIAPAALLVLGWKGVCSVFLWYVDGEVLYMYSCGMWLERCILYIPVVCGRLRLHPKPLTILYGILKIRRPPSRHLQTAVNVPTPSI